MDEHLSPADLATVPASDTEEEGGTKAVAQLDAGARVGRYEVGSVLGQGGMGVVYSAFDPKLQRTIALKVLPTHHRGSAKAQSRLIREAQAMARINHPRVITVHDVGLCPAGIYVAMDRIDGMTVSQWASRFAPDWRTIVEVYLAVLDGLAAVHAAGLIHRDIKPSNIMVGGFEGVRPTRVVVMDFGVAREPESVRTHPDHALSSTDGGRQTRTGALVGTPAYMAPEQFAGEEPDPHSDQFSVCASLYESLYGQRPFAGRRLEHLALQVSLGELAPIPHDAPAVPAGVRRVVLRGLSPRPEERWPSIDALAKALHRSVRRSRGPVLIGAAGVVLAATVAVASGESAAPTCEDGSARAEDVWTSERADAVGVALADEPARQGAMENLDAWVDGWKDARSQACRFVHDGDPVAKDRRIHCLDRQLDALDASAEQWTSTKVPSHSIVTTIAKLSLPASCLDGSAALALDPVEPATRRALEQALAEVNATRRAGEYARARTLAAETIESARRAGARRLQVEAQYELGYLQMLSGQFEESADSLEFAFWIAQDLDIPTISARTASALAYLFAEELVRLDVAEQWLRHAEAQLQRNDGASVELDAEIKVHAALLAEARQRFDDAEVLYRETIALHTERFGGEDVHAAPAYHNLGTLYSKLHRLEDAKQSYARALELRERAFGPAHPDVASSLTGLANIVRSMGELESASELYARALAIRERTLGPDHPRTLAVINGMGIVASMRGQHDEAIAALKQVAERREAIYGRDHPTFGGALNNVGLALGGAGRWDEAAEYHRDAWERLQRAFGADDMGAVGSARSLGAALLEAGRPQEAVEPLEFVVATRRTQDLDVTGRLEEELLLLAVAKMETEEPVEAIALAKEAVTLRDGKRVALVAEARFTLAEAYFAAGELKRARHEARASLALLAPDDASSAGLRSDIESWLREHA